MEEKSPPRVPKLLNKSLKTSEPWAQNEVGDLATIITHTFDLQKQYGKQAGQLENVVKGFCWALKGYSAEIVINAFGTYILRHSDMPTPSDIVKIIDPQPDPFKPDWSIYNRYKKLKEESKYALNQDEEDYMLACEDFTLRQMPKRTV